jgi:hypothetical protein
VVGSTNDLKPAILSFVKRISVTTLRSGIGAAA